MTYDHWKIIAIVALILLALESIFIVVIYAIGIEAVVEEEACMMECYNMGADSYYYDYYTGYCTCYDEDVYIRV